MALSWGVKQVNSSVNEEWKSSLLHCALVHYANHCACICDRHRIGYLRLIGQSSLKLANSNLQPIDQSISNDYCMLVQLAKKAFVQTR